MFSVLHIISGYSFVVIGFITEDNQRNKESYKSRHLVLAALYSTPEGTEKWFELASRPQRLPANLQTPTSPLSSQWPSPLFADVTAAVPTLNTARC